MGGSFHIGGGEALTLNRDGKQCLSSCSQSVQEKIKLPAPHKSVLLDKRKVNFFSGLAASLPTCFLEGVSGKDLRGAGGGGGGGGGVDRELWGAESESQPSGGLKEQNFPYTEARARGGKRSCLLLAPSSSPRCRKEP